MAAIRMEWRRGPGPRRRSLVQGLPVALHPDGHSDDDEEGDRPELGHDLEETVPLQEDAADDPKEVRDREAGADPLGPDRHPAEWEHEAGEQDRREEEEEG